MLRACADLFIHYVGLILICQNVKEKKSVSRLDDKFGDELDGIQNVCVFTENVNS